MLLPPPTPLERSHLDLAFYGLSVRNQINYSPAVFETGRTPEHELLARLALAVQGQGGGANPKAVDDLLAGGAMEAAVGHPASAVHGRDPAELLAESAHRPGPERIVDALVRGGAYGERLSMDELEAHPHGIDLGPLQPRLPGLLRTQSGRIELMPREIVEELERLEAESGDVPGGIVLVGRRHLRSNNSWLHNVERLVRGRDRCTLQIHPDDAKELGLEGEGVRGAHSVARRRDRSARRGDRRDHARRREPAARLGPRGRGRSPLGGDAARGREQQRAHRRRADRPHLGQRRAERNPGRDRGGARMSARGPVAIAAGLSIMALAASAQAGQADVMKAEATCSTIRTCDFEVTVRHADIGFSHYADRWEVIGGDGEVLGVRVLQHPHVHEQPFTRRLVGVEVPEGTGAVTIRARCSKHGHGGDGVTVEIEIPPKAPPAG